VDTGYGEVVQRWRRVLGPLPLTGAMRTYSCTSRRSWDRVTGTLRKTSGLSSKSPRADAGHKQVTSAFCRHTSSYRILSLPPSAIRRMLSLALYADGFKPKAFCSVVGSSTHHDVHIGPWLSLSSGLRSRMSTVVRSR